MPAKRPHVQRARTPPRGADACEQRAPAQPIVAGAGEGISVDFAGRPLDARRLVEGRTSVVHANEWICCQILALIAKAQIMRY